MIAPDEIQVVVLEGTPRERGRSHGEALRSPIGAGVARWKESLHQATGLHPDDYLDRLVAGTGFIPAIERWTPHLFDEVRGIGEGAGITFRDIYAYQLMDEEWIFRSQYTHGAGHAPLEHCSVVGVFGEGSRPTILAQNMDLPKYYDGTQTLLRIKHHDSDLEAFAFTAAGLIATNGLNNRGVGLCVNTLAQLQHSTHGLPVAFVARHVLSCQSLDEAVDAVRTIPHASGQNYAIGDRERIVDLECSATKVVPFAPMPTRVYHTNHPLVNDDLAPESAGAATGPGGKGADAGDEPATALSNSEQRFAFLDDALGAGAWPVTVDSVTSILSTCDVPLSVSRHSAGDGMTLGSLVMELSLPPVLHLSPGPPAETPYREWRFS